MSTGHGQMNPETAAAQIGSTTRQVRQRARWQGWLFLGTAAAEFGFYIAAGSASQAVARALSPLPVVLVAATFAVATRQPVIGRDAARINRPAVAAALAAALAGLVLYQTVMPQGFTGWLVLLAALMVTPLLAAAWQWLRP